MKGLNSFLLFTSLFWSLIAYAGTPTSYQNAFNQLQQWQAQPSSYTLQEAIFTVEDAFYDDSLSYLDYTNQIDNDLVAIVNIITTDNLPVYDALFEFFCDSTWLYNFNDFYGKTNIESIFLTNLMENKVGTCFSYPIYYNILARRMNIPAALSLLPNHLYAQIPIPSYNQAHTNIELSSCQNPSDYDYLPNFHVTTIAVQNGIYMWPLNVQEEILLLMNHLFNLYESEYGYDNWMLERLIETLQSQEANNHILILMQYANCLNWLGDEMEEANVPDQLEYIKIVNAYVGVTSHIDELGYVPESEEQYETYMARLALARDNALLNAQNIIDTTALNDVYALENDVLTNYYNEQLVRNDGARYALGLVANYSGHYRFGFNGKEMDNEVSGQGNQYDYGFRIYNPRIAKFLSVDPLMKKYPMLTTYQFASNTPIWAIDLDGLEALSKTVIQWTNDNGDFYQYQEGELQDVNPIEQDPKYGDKGILTVVYDYNVSTDKPSSFIFTDDAIVSPSRYQDIKTDFKLGAKNQQEKFAGFVNSKMDQFLVWNDKQDFKSSTFTVEGKIKGGMTSTRFPVAGSGAIKSTNTYFATNIDGTDVIGLSTNLVMEKEIAITSDIGADFKFGNDFGIFFGISNKTDFVVTPGKESTESFISAQFGPLVYKQSNGISSNSKSRQFGFVKGAAFKWKAGVKEKKAIGGSGVSSQSNDNSSECDGC